MTTLGQDPAAATMWMIQVDARYKVHASILPQPPHARAASLPGGHSVGVPPDPIPNSAVKPDCANGTIAQAMEE